ncbi:hypothetical protein, partial [Enorma massiliensis]|uniref:hypothetical protein n=1 Tax=Enorma massiliensis TaxID=1472761 RepID=UPI00195BE9B7
RPWSKGARPSCSNCSFFGARVAQKPVLIRTISYCTSTDFDGAARMSAQAAEGVVRESVVDIAERLFYGRDERG